jgi:hypothetical protein
MVISPSRYRLRSLQAGVGVQGVGKVGGVFGRQVIFREAGRQFHRLHEVVGIVDGRNPDGNAVVEPRVGRTEFFQPEGSPGQVGLKLQGQPFEREAALFAEREVVDVQGKVIGIHGHVGDFEQQVLHVEVVEVHARGGRLGVGHVVAQVGVADVEFFEGQPPAAVVEGRLHGIFGGYVPLILRVGHGLAAGLGQRVELGRFGGGGHQRIRFGLHLGERGAQAVDGQVVDAAGTVPGGPAS